MIVRSGTASSSPTPAIAGAMRGLIWTPFGSAPKARSTIA
jgi:hypothetical protein